MPKTPKNASYSSRRLAKSHIQDDLDLDIAELPVNINLEKPQKSSQRRQSTPAERTKRHSNTFPNRKDQKRKGNDPEEGGSLGHKLDRQYRETAQEILQEEDEEQEEKLLLHSKDGLTSTHYVTILNYIIYDPL
jgi:hypothetical protein